MTGTPRFMLLTALTHFEAARRRFGDAAIAPARPVQMFGPLTEALWWALSADEGMERLIGREEHRALRDADPDGRVFPGVLCAWNVWGHERALACGPAGAEPGTPIRQQAMAFRWREAGELPSPSRPAPGMDAYAEHLGGHEVDETLERISNWHATVRAGRPGLLPY